MKIELLALLDLIQVLIQNKRFKQLQDSAIQLNLKKYSGIQIVNLIKAEIDKENFGHALELVENYRVLCKELLVIYNSLVRDYDRLKDDNFKKDIVEILNEKYGVSKMKDILQLLELKAILLDKEFAPSQR
ncbi:MAG: hypothetical protein ACNS62_16395 [Candidatus Cyclobacteriaceae bacterium M3_2C_046]